MNPTITYWVTTPGSTDPPIGPLDAEEIAARVASGAIAKNATACKVGESKWHPVESLLSDTVTPPTPQEVVAIPQEPDKQELKPTVGSEQVTAPTSKTPTEPSDLLSRLKKDPGLVFAGVLIVALVGLLIFVTSGDNAAPELAQCRAAEAKGSLKEAAQHCSNAVKLDKNSESGQMAAKKVVELEAELKKQDDAKAAEIAAAKKAAEDAQDAKCVKWKTICTLGQFPDGSERTTGNQYFPTKAECLSAGRAFKVPCDPCRCVSVRPD